MNLQKKINIAIEGKSASGKGTLARSLAHHFNYHFMDSGALYRTLAKLCINKNIDCNDESKVINEIGSVKLSYEFNKDFGTFLPFVNGKVFTEDIRSDDVSIYTSKISGYKKVRELVIEVQKEFASQKGIIIDGRAVAEESMPDAEAIFYLTASDEVRAKRRFSELKNKTNSTLQDVMRNMIARDTYDENKTIGTLKIHPRAFILDTTDITEDEMKQIAIKKIEEIISKS